MSPTSSATTPAPPFRQTLPSGLHLIVVTTPEAARTAIEVRVRVGSGMESPEQNGLSHLIEHMVFKGAENGKPGDIDRAIESLGGDQLAARTSRDSTRFATVVPTKNWQGALRTVADCLLHPAFRATDLANEKVVIQGEMAQAESVTDRSAYNELAGVAFEVTDADRLSIMGPPANLDRFTADDLRGFWTTWYQPRNFTVVVVGGAPAEEVAHAVETLFPAPAATASPTTAASPLPAPLSPTPLSPQLAPVAPEGIVRVPARPVGQGEGDHVSVTLAFRGPASTDTAALPVAETLLTLLAGEEPTQSRTGRLGQSLVADRHVALGVSAVYLPGRTVGLFLLSATGAGEVGARRLESAMAASLQNFHDNPISDDEVSVARDAAASEVDSEDAAPATHARRLADADARGIPPELADSYAKKIRAVTTADARAAVARYLTPDQYFVTASGGPAGSGSVGAMP